MRILYETQESFDNSFITLTFNDESLPYPPSINVEDLQKFFKRVRFANKGKKIRYFAACEYGSQQDPFSPNQNLGRPHYHAIVFNHAFERGRVIHENSRGEKVYESEELQKHWPFGHVSTGDVTLASAAYVAKYTCKKINGDMAEEHYRWIDTETGEVHALRPERSCQSQGIGRERFERYKQDFEKGYFHIDGKIQPIPRQWKKILTEENNLRYIRSKAKHARKMAKNVDAMEQRRRAHVGGDILADRTAKKSQRGKFNV